MVLWIVASIVYVWGGTTLLVGFLRENPQYCRWRYWPLHTVTIMAWFPLLLSSMVYSAFHSESG